MLADVLVVVGAIGLAGFLTWFFFGKRTAAEAMVAGGVQLGLWHAAAAVYDAPGTPTRLLLTRREHRWRPSN